MKKVSVKKTRMVAKPRVVGVMKKPKMVVGVKKKQAGVKRKCKL